MSYGSELYVYERQLLLLVLLLACNVLQFKSYYFLEVSMLRTPLRETCTLGTLAWSDPLFSGCKQ